jgi:Ser/Thr protein kinase RdoA (MazF antagonist)
MELVRSGKVNRTFLAGLRGGEKLILQFISPVFRKSPALGENWRRVEGALSGRGIPCPKVIPSLSGSLLAEGPGFERLLRLTTFLPGEHPEPGSAAAALKCGRALGAAHTALNTPRPLDLLPLPPGGEYTNQRLPSPDDFRGVSQMCRLHPLLPQVEGLLERGEKLAAELPGDPSFQKIFILRDLAIHGDPKGGNFLGGASSCFLIDWDTASLGDPLIDLAELLRSLAVKKEPPLFDRELAAAAVAGYREAGLRLGKAHWRHLAAAIRAVALNLARRYLTDALLENYFVWDKDAFPSRLAQDTERAEELFSLTEELFFREMELWDL